MPTRPRDTVVLFIRSGTNPGERSLIPGYSPGPHYSRIRRSGDALEVELYLPFNQGTLIHVALVTDTFQSRSSYSRLTPASLKQLQAEENDPQVLGMVDVVYGSQPGKPYVIHFDPEYISPDKQYSLITLEGNHNGSGYFLSLEEDVTNVVLNSEDLVNPHNVTWGLLVIAFLLALSVLLIILLLVRRSRHQNIRPEVTPEVWPRKSKDGIPPPPWWC